MHLDELFDYVLVLGMRGLLIHSLACSLYNLISEKTLQMNLQLLILYLPLVLFIVLREKCTNFFVFMLCHAAVLCISTRMVPKGEMRIIVFGCAAVMALSSIHQRIGSGNEREVCPPSASVFLFLIIYLMAGYMKRPIVMNVSYYEAFLFLILFAIHRNLKNTADFMKLSKGIANLPDRQIKGMNQMLLVLFVLFLIAVMIVMQYLPAGYLLRGSGELLLMVIRGVLWILVWIFSRKSSQQDMISPAADKSIMPLETGKTSVLLQILDHVIKAAVSLLIVAGAVYLVIRIFYVWYKRFYEQQKESADESEFLWKQPLDGIVVKRKRQKQEKIKDTSINKKIRQIYKKNIRLQYGKKVTVPVFMTPSELEADIALKKEKADRDSAEIIQKRTLLYEKARYSQHVCEKQEIEVMKQMVNRKRQ